MAMPTYQEIQTALAKQVDYDKLATLLETDLNAIAQELITDGTQSIEFEVFFEENEFDTAIQPQGVGTGQGFTITPVLVRFINGDYSTARGPQFFTNVFSIEVMALEKDRENVRKVFEAYSYLNQGRIDAEDELGVSNSDTAVLFTTRTLEFPTFEDPVQYKGAIRIQGFMRLFITYLYTGQLANQITTTLDGDSVILQNLVIKRQRTPDAAQRNDETEVKVIHKSQILSFSAGMLYDGSDAAKAILRNIKNNGSGLNDQFTFVITYPNITTTSASTWESTNDTNYDPLLDGDSDTPENLFGPASDYPIGTICRIEFPEVQPGAYIYFIVTEGSQVADADIYTVVVDGGEITVMEGGVLSLSFNLVLA